MGEYKHENMIFKEAVPGVFVADEPYYNVDMCTFLDAKDSLFAAVKEHSDGTCDVYAVSVLSDFYAGERLKEYVSERFPELTFCITQGGVPELGVTLCSVC